MTKWTRRAGFFLLLVFVLAHTGFAKSSAKSKRHAHKKAERSAEPKTPAPAPAAMPAQQPAGNRAPLLGSPADIDNPNLAPMLATTGTIGMFSVETGDTLPPRGFAFSGYGNKFSRQPGSVSVLSMGASVSVGLTDRLTFYGNMQPYVHTHVGNPDELSLSQVNDGNVQYAPSVFHTLPSTGLPGYVEDYPFAANDSGGIGEVTLGLKFGLLSERRGAPVSLSIRNDFIFPTRTKLVSLLENGTQTGQFNDTIALALSKQLNHFITGSFNWGYRFTRDPRQYGVPLFTMADQMNSGFGFLFLTDRRIQPMMEYTALTFVGAHTPDSAFGARDPIDGVWGVRAYLGKNLGIDIGYRYMLNLNGANDRNGFVIKLGTTYWTTKPASH